MYHYVRDSAVSRYPAIKALSCGDFDCQLDKLQSEYNVVGADDIIARIVEDRPLPANAAWLTFDDGLIDHYTNVFPRLVQRRISASFFPPRRQILERMILDVHKVHLILASEPNAGSIIARVKTFVEDMRGTDGLLSFEEYWRSLAVQSRFDGAEVIFIKRSLQHALPQPHRSRLVDAIFREVVGTDQKMLASELYMTEGQLRTMVSCGMHVGGHGDAHLWLNRVGTAEQRAEIDGSLELLRRIGVPQENWVMCYPYGGYNAETIDILRGTGCAVGVTAEPRLAELDRDDPLLLPRIDTNDFHHAPAVQRLAATAR
jgi:peptidoglycan/xylan/chitin deacetylase (PgdA/CDA1 family)